MYTTVVTRHNKAHTALTHTGYLELLLLLLQLLHEAVLTATDAILSPYVTCNDSTTARTLRRIYSYTRLSRTVAGSIDKHRSFEITNFSDLIR